MPTQIDVNLIKTIMHDTHTNKGQSRWKGGKNGNASSNTMAACVVVCCPSQTQMTTRESFLTIGCYIMQKDRMSKRALEEQRGVNTD